MSILLLTSVSTEEETMWLKQLRSALPEEDIRLLAELNDKADVDMAIVANPPQGVLHTLPKLKLIQSLWAGVDALLGDPTLPENITKPGGRGIFLMKHLCDEVAFFDKGRKVQLIFNV